MERKLIKTIGWLSWSVLLSACSQHAQNPVLVVPDQWDVANHHYKNSTANLPCFAWWQQFNDPNLNALIDKGLIYNNDIKVAVAHIDAAQGELKRVQLNWIPDVTGNAGYSSFPYLGFPGVLLTVVPAYTLNIFKQIKEQQQAQHELKATTAMHQGARLAVISQITVAYFNYLGQRERLALLHELQDDLSQLITIAQVMHQGGLSARTEIDRAKTELALIQAKERVVQQNKVVSANALHYLLDENPAPLSVTRRFQDLKGQQMIIGALPINIIEHRPDLMQAKQELLAANAGMGMAFSSLLPTLNLAMARGEIAKVDNGSQLGQAIHFNQALVEVPFLKASTYGQLVKTKGLEYASYYRYSDTLRKALRDVTNDLSAHELYTQRLHDVVKAKQEFHHAYRLQQALYQRGIISHLSLLREKVHLDELALEVNQHQLEQLITVVHLYQNLAAGYNYVPEHPAG